MQRMFHWPDFPPVFADAAAAAGFRATTLLETTAGPLQAWERAGDGPVVYLSAGIHGDEPAGPLALLDLMAGGFFADGVRWLVCPALNPTGLAAGTRDNADGIDLNRDYRQLRTREIAAHHQWLARQPLPQLFLSLHEDWETRGFYLYEINPGDDLPGCARAILEAVRPWFPPENTAEIDGHTPREPGWIFHQAEPDLPHGWPEAIHLAKLGCPLSFTFETPSHAVLADRVAGHCAAVRAACRDFLGTTHSRSKSAGGLPVCGMDLFTPTKAAESPKPLSVTQLLRRIKNLIETQIGELWVEGEVSNLRKQASGHWYFSLKDEGAQISCAMFGARRRQGSEALEDGAMVRVFAEAGVYEARGQLQIIVLRAERAGMGDLQARFEALKRKLQAEGLFDADRKRSLPAYPKTIGIVTSASGAALQDILNVLTRRAPWVQPVLFPVRVQGRGAELEIARAIDQLGNPERHRHPRCDVLIVGRGGGSIEDLWNFNEEVVARAIAACPIPVISAVGHEIDFTIADFVADLRAPTPSAAAELAVADGAELLEKLSQLRRRLDRHAHERLQRARMAVDALRRGALQRGGERLLREPMMRIDHLHGRLVSAAEAGLKEATARLTQARAGHRAHHPARVLERRIDHLAHLHARLRRNGERIVSERTEQLRHLGGLLRALGPESAFQRGFSITMDEQGNILRSVAGIEPGRLLQTRLADGKVASRVVDG